MQSNVNMLVIQGNLVKDPECKDINGTMLCEFTLASNRVFKETKDTCYIDVKCWGNKSAVVEKFLFKGSPVIIEGRLQQDKWTSKEGENRSKHIVMLNSLTLLPSQNRKHEDDSEDKAMKDDRELLF